MTVPSQPPLSSELPDLGLIAKINLLENFRSWFFLGTITTKSEMSSIVSLSAAYFSDSLTLSKVSDMTAMSMFRKVTCEMKVARMKRIQTILS